MRHLSLFIAVLSLCNGLLYSQVAINGDGSPAAASAILDLSTSDKGFLLPRLTQYQIEAISVPADGLQVFCTTNSKMYIYVAALGQWKEVAYGSGILTPPFTCGISITIQHSAAGGVAPVDKTTTYGTVTNIPGTATKCWITSNFGSDHQATAVNDATEASAGWYWQFNLMQGYKHDGATVSPAWTITSISENSDWVAAHDPCTIELANNWRIPTYTELYNVDVTGNWTDWNGPWNSGVKMHAAGYLNTNGSLHDRGSSGFYTSATQNDNTRCKYLQFNSSFCVTNFIDKALGYTLRCIRD